MIKFKNLNIGKKFPPAMIIELGINHGGSLDKAIFPADKALGSGAKLIKHQTHILED